MSVTAEHLKMQHDTGKLVMRNVTIVAVEMQRKCVGDSYEVQCGCMVISQFLPLQINTL